MRKFLRAYVISKLIGLALVGTCAGQIAPARAQEIRRALDIRGYHGDTMADLKKVAIDHKWQHASVPDSRVIIWLGLGPKYPHLLNPKTAWISTPKSVIAMGRN